MTTKKRLPAGAASAANANAGLSRLKPLLQKCSTNLSHVKSRFSFFKPHPYQESDMHRKPYLIAALLALLSAAFEAGAACTAGNPNASVAESTPTSAFTDNGNGTVTHNLTGLTWKQCAEGLSTTTTACDTGSATAMTWSAALSAAATSGLDGGGWRLPNKKELESLVKRCGYTPSINQTLFPATPPMLFWSSSTYVPSSPSAWGVVFDVGDSGADGKTNGGYVRLVRGGQSFDSFDSQTGITPDAFSFTAQTDAARSGVATSNTITVTGINSAAYIRIVGGTYSINGGAYTAVAGTVNNNDTVTVRQTSSGSYSTLTTATLTIGGVNSAFQVATLNLAVSSIVVDPVAPAILYAGFDDAGVYKSTDSGANWTAATIQPANTRVMALVIQPGDSAKLYAATYGGGAFKSADSGANWSACATQPANLNLLSLTMDAAGKLYAGSEAGVFVSSDGCTNWAAINTGLPL
ncbi:MAG: DUF1566 domain-containing protein [Gallionella sp.]|nr:DUF1566 domain-containing protein [Gallionella sp.]